MKSLLLVALCLSACTIHPPLPPSPFAGMDDPLALARLAVQDDPLATLASQRLVLLSDWGAFKEPIDLTPAIPVFRDALRSPLPAVRRRALHALAEIAAAWTYGFEVGFLGYRRPEAYAAPFIEPLLPELIALIEGDPQQLRYEAIHRGLTFAHLLVVMDRRSPSLEAALREAQSADDEMIAAFAIQTVHTLDTLIHQPRCRPR